MSNIEDAVKVFQDGGIVIFPTDTAYGIGCRMDDENAIEKLFKIRKRPITQATSVLVKNFDMAKNYLAPVDSEVLEKLIKPYWPGGLTVVLKCAKEKVPEFVRGGGDTLGVRMPDHKDLLEIIEKVGVPILGPSANFHGEKTPFKFEDLNPKITKLVDYVLEGKTGGIQSASTVIDCTNKPWRILRQGVTKISNF